MHDCRIPSGYSRVAARCEGTFSYSVPSVHVSIIVSPSILSPFPISFCSRNDNDMDAGPIPHHCKLQLVLRKLRLQQFSGVGVRQRLRLRPWSWLRVGVSFSIVHGLNIGNKAWGISACIAWICGVFEDFVLIHRT
jgi:hypothetical protein